MKLIAEFAPESIAAKLSGERERLKAVGILREAFAASGSYISPQSRSAFGKDEAEWLRPRLGTSVLGATGAILTFKAFDEWPPTGGRYAMVIMCMGITELL